MKHLILILSLGLLCMSSRKDDDLFVELDYSYYDPAYIGDNPITIDSTRYFQQFIYDPQTGVLTDTIDKATIYCVFDESVLGDGNQGYFLSLDGQFPHSPNSEGVVSLSRVVDTDITGYCSEVRFHDSVLNAVHTYTMCYTIEY